MSFADPDYLAAMINELFDDPGSPIRSMASITRSRTESEYALMLKAVEIAKREALESMAAVGLPPYSPGSYSVPVKTYRIEERFTDRNGFEHVREREVPMQPSRYRVLLGGELLREFTVRAAPGIPHWIRQHHQKNHQADVIWLMPFSKTDLSIAVSTELENVEYTVEPLYA